MYQTCAGIVPIIGYTALLGQDYENYWSSFSGKQEIGETPPQTAIREFNEETSNMWGLTPQQFEKRLLAHKHIPQGIEKSFSRCR